jgi:hypothetical protein
MRRAAFLVTAAAGASVLAAGTVVAAAGPAAAQSVLYAYAAGTGSPAGCPQDHTGMASNECSLSQALTQAQAGDKIELATPGTTHYLGNWTVNTLNTSATAPGLSSQPVLDGNNGSATGCSTTACDGPVLTRAGRGVCGPVRDYHRRREQSQCRPGYQHCRRRAGCRRDGDGR